MRSPYFYILMRSPLLVYSNKMEYNKKSMVVYYIQSTYGKKMKYNKPNTKRKTRKRKKKQIFCRGREMAKTLPRQRGHSSRLLLTTGTNGPGQGASARGHVHAPSVPGRNTTGTNGGGAFVPAAPSRLGNRDKSP